MPATVDSVGVTPGSGVNVATYDITESSLTKSLQRIVQNDSSGNEKGTNTYPQIVQANIPSLIQNTSNISSGSVASLAKAFVSNNIVGNSIIVVCAVGNGTAPTVTDTAGNTYTKAAQIANGTALNTAVFYAVNILAGANTVTVNNGGTTASIAMEIYEVNGLLTQVPSQPDVTATATGSSGTAATSAIAPVSPNEYAFAAVGVGTAAQTITPASGWTNDSGQQNPTTPAGLFSFISMSQFLGSTKPLTPQATFTSEPWAIAVATFRPVLLSFEGSIGSSSPTGSAVPANAFYLGITDGTNLRGIKDANTVDDGSRAGIFKTALVTYHTDGSLQMVRNAITADGTTSGVPGMAQMGYDGAVYRSLRVPGTFKTATATASGNTAVWTPAAGKKFRLMKFRIEVTNDAAQSSAGDIDLIFQDNTTNMAVAVSVYVPGSAGTTIGSTSSGWIDLGNGILSAAANNVLNINLSAALTSGKVRVIAVGTEE